MPKQGDNWGIVAATGERALPHAESARRDVTAKSPRERLAEAVAAGPLSPAERTTFHSQIAAVRAADEARRAAPSPQAALDFRKAA